MPTGSFVCPYSILSRLICFVSEPALVRCCPKFLHLWGDSFASAICTAFQDPARAICLWREQKRNPSRFKGNVLLFASVRCESGRCFKSFFVRSEGLIWERISSFRKCRAGNSSPIYELFAISPGPKIIKNHLAADAKLQSALQVLHLFRKYKFKSTLSFK